MPPRSSVVLRVAALAVVALAGCSSSHVAPSGDGVCCAIADFSGCSPGADPLPGGGWAASAGACTYTIQGFDGSPYSRVSDEHGCPRLEETGGCCGCVPPEDAGREDAGPPPVDASAPGECAGLGAAACFAAADCAPVFDDACCPDCSPTGFCADCTDYTYVDCRPFDGCRGYCGSSPSWGCFPSAPDCSGAAPTDEDSCSQTGCVPAVAPVGATPIEETCVPITGDSCTIACRWVAPDCPEGTVPEGDGSCYTDRCIPAFVCL